MLNRTCWTRGDKTNNTKRDLIYKQNILRYNKRKLADGQITSGYRKGLDFVFGDNKTKR
jgi:hypothetical protein